MTEFNELLDANLEHIDNITQQGKHDALCAIGREIKLVEKRLNELKVKFRHAQEEFNASLATNLRKRTPGLSINLNNGSCSANYKSKLLVCRPNIESNRWQFEPNNDGRRFMRNHGPHGPALSLSNDTSGIADAISNYFSNHYKSLTSDNI